MRCKKCLFQGKRKFLRSKGNVNADLFIVGESPGKLELILNEPFVGEAGGLLNWFLKKSKIIKNEEDRYKNIFMSNAIKCYPTVGSTENDKYNISVSVIDMCRSLFLKKSIEKVKPKIILCLGSVAFKSVLKDYKISIKDNRGFWIWSEEFKSWIIGTYHPAKVLTSWGDTSSVLKDFEKVKYALDHGVPEQKVGTNYTLINSFKEVPKLFKRLGKQKRVTFDIESTSTRFWMSSEEILGFSFSWKEGQGIWLPLRKSGEFKNRKLWKKTESVRILNYLKEFLENKKIKKDGANIKFDINWCRSIKINPKGIDWDIMMFHHLIDENTPSNLTYLTTYYNLNFPRYANLIGPYIRKHPSIIKSKTYEFIPQKILGFYGCADVDATFRISEIQRKLADKRQLKLYRTQSIPLSKTCQIMEEKGVLIDIDKIDKTSLEYDKEIMKEEKHLFHISKVSSINVNSPPQVSSLLYEKLKFPVLQKTKTGNPSTGKEVLQMLILKTKSKKKRKILNFISNIRTMKKLKSTYLEGFKILVDNKDRVHTNYLTIGTVTGRISSTNPNLLNIPRNPLFRSIFISGKNRRVVVADYSQIEDRIMAFYAGETDLLKLYEDAEFDPHTITSSMIRKIPLEKVTKEQRSFDKAVKFGLNYGRSEKSIANTYNLDIEEVEEFVSTYFDTYKQIYKFRQKCIRLSKANGYLKTPSGRIRHFTGYEWLYSEEMNNVMLRREDTGTSNYIIQSIIGNMERQALNFKIQSFAFDLLIAAMTKIRLKLKSRFPKSFLVMQVYDMVLVDCPKTDAKEIKKLVIDCMTKTLTKKNGVSVTLPVDCEVSKCWIQ